MLELEKVVAALDRGDLRAATQLLKPLMQRYPHDPWVRFYAGRLYEASGKLPAAEAIYRQMLRETASPKLALQARQGLGRISTSEQRRRQQALDEARSHPVNAELGFMVLEPVVASQRQAIAQSFAQIMNLDPYTVRMTLPSRSWQLYRTGPIGELRVFVNELQQASIGAFCASLGEIQKVQVLRVHYLKAVSPTATIVCQSADDQIGSLEFSWHEVAQQVIGRLPIFEEVFDLGVRGKPQRKRRTLDYVQCFDLHLPDRNLILRFCDQTYQFQCGVEITPVDAPAANPGQSTVRISWNYLVGYLQQQLPQTPVMANFTAFGETTLDHQVPLDQVRSYLDLERRIETHWDSAFQLYSTLAYLKAFANSAQP